MAQLLLNRCFWLPLVRISSLTCSLAFLLVISGCSGSQLGDTIGEKLEPDPQLAENSEIATGSQSGADTGDSATPESRQSAAANSTTQANTEDAQNVVTPSDATDATDATEGGASTTTPEGDSDGYTDIAQAHEEIRPYLIDLLALDVLELRPSATPSTPSTPSTGTAASTPSPTATPSSKANEFLPNQAITRREYARWLLATNNRFYSGQRTHRIRPAVSSSQPIFQDVKANDPDFAAIQGLAEAGMIPSPLTGSSTTITFRPEAPLTRKDLLLWKVPLDTRQPLPQATASAVQTAWGFQDAPKIEARALQAVLADHQNGEFSNIQRAFGYTTLFQPDKAATRAEAAAVLWRIGNTTEAITAAELRAPQTANSPQVSPAEDGAGNPTTAPEAP